MFCIDGSVTIERVKPRQPGVILSEEAAVAAVEAVVESEGQIDPEETPTPELSASVTATPSEGESIMSCTIHRMFYFLSKSSSNACRVAISLQLSDSPVSFVLYTSTYMFA